MSSRFRTVEGRSESLRAGWNAVGFAAQQVTDVTGGGQVAGVASWNGSSYETSALTAPLNGRKGYWVYAHSATTFTWSGGDDGQGSYVDLSLNGYNLVSLASDVEVPGASLTATQNGRVLPLGSVVLTRFYECGPDGYTTVDVDNGGVLKPGRAYWVYANTGAGAIRLNFATAGPSPSPASSPSPSPGLSPSPSSATSPSPQGSPASLAFIQPPPSSFTADATFTVKVASSETVTLALGTAPAQGQLSGSLTAPPVNGVATFPGLSLNRVGSYTLRAQAGALSVESLAFTVSPGQPAALKFTQQPLGATWGESFFPYIAGEVTDAQGNRVPGAAPLVTIRVDTGYAYLSGQVGNPAVDGRWSFAGTQVFGPLGVYAIRAEATGLSSAISQPFSLVDPGPGSLAFNPTPPATAVVGQPITVQVQVTGGTGNVVVLAADPGQEGIATATTTATGNVATFTVVPTRVGTFQLRASMPGLAGPSPVFNLTVQAGAPAALRFAQQPTDLAAGDPCGAVVEAVDSGGNRVTSATGAVSLTLASGQGSLVGATTRTLTNGQTDFPGLQLSRLSPLTRLRATWNGFTVDSEPFAVKAEQVNRDSDTLPVALGPISNSQTFTSRRRALSADGRYALFASGTLAGGNGVSQIYRRDRQTGATEVVTSHQGVLSDAGDEPLSGSISADGRYVVFVSSSNFGGAFTRQYSQVYLRDMNTASLRLVSATAPFGTVGCNGDPRQPLVSRDGTFVAYYTEATNVAGGTGLQSQVYRYRTSTAQTQVVIPNHPFPFSLADMAPDGDTFLLGASAGAQLLNLTAGGNAGQLYVARMSTGSVELASRRAGGGPLDGSNDGAEGGSLADDGRRVAFGSRATDLTSPPTANFGQAQAFYRDLTANSTVLLSRRAGTAGSQGSATGSNLAVISGDGRTVGFYCPTGDVVSGVTDANLLYRWQAETGLVTPWSLPSGYYWLSLSRDGRLAYAVRNFVTLLVGP